MTTAWNADTLLAAQHIDDHGTENNQTWVVVVAAAGWLVMATIAVLLFTGIWTPDGAASQEPAPAPEQQSDRPAEQAINRTVVPRPRVPQPQTTQPQPRAPEPRAPQTGS